MQSTAYIWTSVASFNWINIVNREHKIQMWKKNLNIEMVEKTSVLHKNETIQLTEKREARKKKLPTEISAR